MNLISFSLESGKKVQEKHVLNVFPVGNDLESWLHFKCGSVDSQKMAEIYLENLC